MSSKAKKKKPQVVAEEDDELDQLLEDFNLKPNEEEKGQEDLKVPETKQTNQEPGQTADTLEKDEEDLASPKASAVSKSKKRKEKKKEKKEREKDPEDPETDKSKGKKISAAAQAAAERLKLVQELEERQRVEEELEKKRIEEEEKRIKMLEEQRERERLLKKQQRHDRRERLKQQGKLLSSKEKENLARNKLFVEQLKARGILPPELPVASGDPTDTRKRPLIDTRKRKAKHHGVTENDEDKLQERTTSSDKAEVHPEEQGSTPRSEEEADSSAGSVNDDWEKLPLDSDTDTHPPPTVESQTKPKPAPKPVTKTVEETIYRSPVCCVLGHVDTGKTKLLDKIRHTNVQKGEAGGITQQIGATFFPREALESHAKTVNPNFNVQIPGLLIIDTPGHESFNNLRARGSSLCDIAILLVDVMHGLEPQTIESIGLLKNRKCPFIIAMNKVDRIYGWKSQPWKPILETLSHQKESTKEELIDRIHRIQADLSAQGLNCKIYWENDDFRKNISICPTSAITGEGIPDLLFLIMKLVQMFMSKEIKTSNTVSCHILEVKNIEGLGPTVDVILLTGELQVGDAIVACGMNGPIVTTIRAILTPQPLKESRVKSEYVRHNKIKGTIGVKIVSQGLEDAVAGTELLLSTGSDDIDTLKEEVMQDMSTIFNCVDRSGVGVYLMASTLGSLEALLQFIKDQNIPVFCVNIGTVQKKDIKKASVMNEKRRPEYATILAFDVKVTPDAEKEAAVLGVTIFSADIIYHLTDQFFKHLEQHKEIDRKNRSHQVVFPCELSIIPQYIFNKKDPLIFGVRVEAGLLKVGTPLVVPDKDNLMLGHVSSLEFNNKPTEKALKGQEVCIKICGEPNVMYGRHFDSSNKLFSKITRDSIDCLKEFFRDEVPKDGWQLVVQLKKIFNII